MSDSPEYKAAQYAYKTYHQRRIDIADNYSRQCDANSDRLVSDLVDIAHRYNLAPTRVVTYAFGNARPDFIGRVRRTLSAFKAQEANGGHTE